MLVVDDNGANLEAFAALLAPLGTEVRCASSGEEAVSIVLREERDFSVILLDVRMPGIDGYETARRIRESKRCRHIPIIFLTAYDQEPRFVAQGYSVGAVDFLCKPVDPDVLRCKVEVFLELWRRAALIREQAEQIREAADQKLREYQRWSEQRYVSLADAVPELVWTAEPDGTLSFRNQRWFECLSDGAVPPELDDVMHPADVAAFQEGFAEARERGEPWEAELRFVTGSPLEARWHLVHIAPIKTPDGAVTSWVGTATNIESQKRAQTSLRMLAELTRSLGELTEGAPELEDVLQRALPVLGDAALIELRSGGGEARRVAVATPGMKVPPLDEPRLVTISAAVAASGRPEIHLDVAQSAEAGGDEGEHARALSELGIHAYVCLPLVLREGLMGSLAVLSAGSARRYSEADLVLAEDVARRLATALDNLRLYEVAQEERRRLAEASHAKDVFLATLSHELRTPLNAIVGWSHLLKTGELGSEQSRKAVDTIERNSSSLAQLVADLLDVSRIISGNMKVELRPISLRKLVEAALDAARPAAENGGLSLELALCDGEARVLGDAGRLEQAIGNVMTNALKFTPSGGMIRVTLEELEHRSRLSISDSGQGMTPEFLAVAFEPFKQAHRTHARSQDGLGLGLSIVKHLVELHGGRVSAESPGAGMGSTIVMELPLLVETEHEPRSMEVQEPAAPSPARQAPNERPMLGGVHALVVEDDPDGCELLETVLRGFGARVTTANSARSAFEVLASQRPDVVVSDIGLPDEDGLSLIRRVRQTHGLADVPAVALTAYASKRDVAQALAAGFQAHVAKPVEPRALGLAIARACRGVDGSA